MWYPRILLQSYPSTVASRPLATQPTLFFNCLRAAPLVLRLGLGVVPVRCRVCAVAPPCRLWGVIPRLRLCDAILRPWMSFYVVSRTAPHLSPTLQAFFVDLVSRRRHVISSVSDLISESTLLLVGHPQRSLRIGNPYPSASRARFRTPPVYPFGHSARRRERVQLYSSLRPYPR
jgi:hypothetical protein